MMPVTPEAAAAATFKLEPTNQTNQRVYCTQSVFLMRLKKASRVNR